MSNLHDRWQCVKAKGFKMAGVMSGSFLHSEPTNKGLGGIGRRAKTNAHTHPKKNVAPVPRGV